MKKIIITLVVFTALGCGALLFYVASKNLAPLGFLDYQNTTYAYTVSYPNTLQTKEYSPENIVFGHVSGDSVESVVEIRAMTVRGESGETFDEALARELENLCAADGPTTSLSCTDIESKKEFKTTSGIEGSQIYLHGVLTNFTTHATSTLSKGPYYVFMLGTGATATKILTIGAPLNKSAEESDGSTIESVARSLVFPSGEIVGQ